MAIVNPEEIRVKMTVLEDDQFVQLKVDNADRKQTLEVEENDQTLNLRLAENILVEGGGGGTSIYDNLRNKPAIEERVLRGGNNTLGEININRITNLELEEMLS